MGADSKIEWTDHTFNPWWGCTKVSPGCDHCYAEALAKRYGHNVWGAGNQRRVMSQKHWQEPFKWNERARKAGRVDRVFCASMADVFDNEAPEQWRMALWQVIRGTPGGSVLDPFCGSASTAVAAREAGCSFVGVEINPEYVSAARERLRTDAPLLALSR
jgi:SAM-dependent methyltransferase